MKRFFAGLLLAALLTSAQAADAPPLGTRAAAALAVAPERRGYAAEQSEILLRQRLFGRAHGLSLLAAACLGLPAYSTAIQDAYHLLRAFQTPIREDSSLIGQSHFAETLLLFGCRRDEVRIRPLTLITY